MVERGEENGYNNKITERVTKDHQVIIIKRSQDQPDLSGKGRNKKPGQSQRTNARLHQQKAWNPPIPNADRPQALENKRIWIDDQATQEGFIKGGAYVGGGHGGVQ